jgi:hypothetical protein
MELDIVAPPIPLSWFIFHQLFLATVTNSSTLKKKLLMMLMLICCERKTMFYGWKIVLISPSKQCAPKTIPNRVDIHVQISSSLPSISLPLASRMASSLFFYGMHVITFVFFSFDKPFAKNSHLWSNCHICFTSLPNNDEGFDLHDHQRSIRW